MNTGTLAVPQPRGPGRAATEHQTSTVNGPPLTLTSNTHVASITELRTEITNQDLCNPNPLGAANELVDQAILEAPDGTQIKVRTLYDTGAQDSIIDWKLSRFSHHV